MNKKTKQLIALGGVTLGALAVGSQVDASDARTTTQGVPKAVAESNVEKVTEEAVQDAKATMDKAEADVKAQETVVEAKDAKVSELTKQVNVEVPAVSELDVKDAETAVKIEETNKAQAEVEKAQVEASKVKADEAVKSAKAEADKTQADEAVAKEAVKKAESEVVAVDGSSVLASEKDVEKAQAEVNRASVAAANAGLELDKAKDADKERDARVAEAKSNLEAVSKEKVEAEKDIAEADKEVKAVESELAKADFKYPTSIKLSAEWIKAFNDLRNYKADSSKPREERLKIYDALMEKVIEAEHNRSQERIDNGEYDKEQEYWNSLEDNDKGPKYDVRNIPAEVKQELNLYFATVLNSVRSQLGLPEVKVNENLMELANIIAKNYEGDATTDPDNFAHNYNAINSATTQVGLKKGTTENLAQVFSLDSLTMSGLYHTLYDNVKQFIFESDNGSNYGHALSLTSQDTIGLSFSTYRKDSLTGGIPFYTHVISTNNYQTSSKDEYETKYGVNSKDTLENVKYSDGTEAKAKLEVAKQQYAEAKSKLDSVNTKLANAERELAEANKPSQVPAAFEKLSKAQVELINAKEILSKANLRLQQAKDKQGQDKEAYAQAKLKLEQANDAYVQAKENNSTAQKALLSAIAKQKQAELELADKNDKLVKANDKLTLAKQRAEKLTNDYKNKENIEKEIALAKDALEIATKEQQQAKDKLAQLVAQYEVARAYYNSVKTQYELENIITEIPTDYPMVELPEGVITIVPDEFPTVKLPAEQIATDDKDKKKTTVKNEKQASNLKAKTLANTGTTTTGTFALTSLLLLGALGLRKIKK